MPSVRFLFIYSFILILSFINAQSIDSITATDVQHAQKIMQLSFEQAEIDSMLELLNEQAENYTEMRGVSLSNAISPSLVFYPLPENFEFSSAVEGFKVSQQKIDLPNDLNQLAYASVGQLSYLIRNRKITSVQLTKMYLERLKKYGPTLQCVITLMEEEALKEAAQADKEIATGRYRGPLHGIPYGIKDLFSVKGTKTTWGAMPFKDQVIETDAAVVEKLREAGAILVAKLTLGALAWGDVWFGGMTKNPWDLNQGSSGSSAGSASATAAGLVAFSIGTETWGSIVSPSTRCGVSGVRPTFGRVSRYGAMALSWSMDKVGPICRTVEDCAIVLQAISGADERDPSTMDFPLTYQPSLDLSSVKIGYIKSAFEEDYPNKELDLQTLQVLKKMGAQLIPIELPELPVSSLSFVLSAEAAAAFDELTRSNRDTLLVRQIKNAWPNVFRAARFIPAVEYIQANRIRTLLIHEMEELFSEIDAYICPSFGGDNLLLTNLTGHPCVVIPNGFDKDGHPHSISLIGKLFDEGTIMTIANMLQKQYRLKPEFPPLFP